MNDNCKNCNINQGNKIADALKLYEATREKLNKSILDFLNNADATKSNPEILCEMWRIIADTIGDDDPYREIKDYYNKAVMKLSGEVDALFCDGDDRLDTALRIAIAGNLIDFGAKHSFSIEDLKSTLHRVMNERLAIDDSEKLFFALAKAKTLLYLGDNCGEIALDKVFLREIGKRYPDIKAFYGVKGKPVVNDITKTDAQTVGMSEVATVVSNGDGASGTVLKNTSEEFKRIFNKADVVICKGQGNYESLIDEKKDNMFFLFMAKCENFTIPLNIAPMSIVCLKKK